MTKMKSPEGSPIVGTYEFETGTCEIEDVTRNADGSFEYTHTGAEDFGHQSQTVTLSDGQVVFRDSMGKLWPERSLIPIDQPPLYEGSSGEQVIFYAGLTKRDHLAILSSLAVAMKHRKMIDLGREHPEYSHEEIIRLMKHLGAEDL